MDANVRSQARLSDECSDLYAEDLVIMVESQDKCVLKLLRWKEGMEKKGLDLRIKMFSRPGVNGPVLFTALVLVGIASFVEAVKSRCTKSAGP